MGLPGQGDTVANNSMIKVGEIEVLYPGVAYTWTEDATGLRIKTNLKAKDCNRRPGDEERNPGIVFFKTDAALWAWAKRVMKSTEKRVV